MFPISDDNPRQITPVVTWGLIAACVAVFLWQAALGTRAGEVAIYAFGMIPARLFGAAQLPAGLEYIPAWATLFSSMFMHGGWLHLGSNMLYLWIFGDNVEEAMGHGRYLVFYLVCGVTAAMVQAVLHAGSEIPMVGASGAISGILGAYLLLHPHATVRVLIFLGFFITMAHIPALFVLGFWGLLQLFSAATAPADAPGVAFWAHVGGFVTGMVLVPFFKHRGVGLLQPARSRRFEIERRRGPWG